MMQAAADDVAADQAAQPHRGSQRAAGGEQIVQHDRRAVPA